MKSLLPVLALVALTSCSCAGTKVTSDKGGFSYRTTDQWELLTPPNKFPSEIEATALGNAATKTVVVFTAVEKVSAGDLAFVLWMTVAQREGMTTVPPAESTLIKGGVQFEALYQGAHLRLIAVDGVKYTYIVQVFTPAETELSKEAIRLIESFRIE